MNENSKILLKNFSNSLITRLTTVFILFFIQHYCEVYEGMVGQFYNKFVIPFFSSA